MTDRERNVQKDMMTIIRKYKGYVYKNAQNMYTEKGRPDLTACVPVKIKAAKGLWFSLDDPAIVEALMIKLRGDSSFT